MPVESKAVTCSCGQRLLAASDQALSKAYKDHREKEHDEEISLEDALGTVQKDGFDPQDEGDGNIDLSISR